MTWPIGRRTSESLNPIAYNDTSVPAPVIIAASIPALVARRQKASIRAGTQNVAAAPVPLKTTITCR